MILTGAMATPSYEIIGRDPEREVIGALLARPRPSVLVIDGEAGIGKSTLWSFAYHAAGAGGDRVLAWRATEAERELPYAALIGLLEPDIEPMLEQIPDPHGRALATALGRTRDGDVAHEPSLVGLALLDVVRAASRSTPLTIALDDAQWCDPASGAALAFAARRLRSDPVALVLVLRSGTPASLVSEILAALPEERRERLPVGPLTIGALGRLIRERTDVVHPRPLLVRIHEASSGNPFVALEMSRSLARHGATPAAGEPFPVSPEAGPLVRDHLATLSEPARTVLLVVAMASQPTVGLVRRIVGEDAEAAIG
jgi:hypothetical protein